MESRWDARPESRPVSVVEPKWKGWMVEFEGWWRKRLLLILVVGLFVVIVGVVIVVVYVMKKRGGLKAVSVGVA